MGIDKIFARDFNVALVRPHLQLGNSLIREIFDRWVLPGQSQRDGQKPLRMALRNRYLNFYADGQSIARLTEHGDKLRMTLANAYVPEAFSVTSKSGQETRLEGGQLLVESPGDAIDQIVDRALNHPSKSDEKCFVEQLIAANSNIIEVEMALPGETGMSSVRRKWRDRGARKIAPRMDIVAAHILPNGTPQIDFWEAKLASNAELRATLPTDCGKEEPKVREQLLDYERWMRLEHRGEQVRAAFQNAGRTLEELAEEAGKTGAARDLWQKLAATLPEINPRPGILVANYDPTVETHQDIKTANSFERHRDRLLQACTDPKGTQFPALNVVEVQSRECEALTLDQPMRISQF